MSDKFFLDTNIIIYTFDKASRAKQKKALALVGEAMEEQTGIISYQVVQEFLNVAGRKFATPLHPQDLKLYLKEILLPLCEVHSSHALFRQAVDLHEETGYAFYDCLIISGALEGGCRVLYSEDLQSGRAVDGLRIVNPF